MPEVMLMAQMYGVVEFRIVDEWYDVINVSSFILQSYDLNGCRLAWTITPNFLHCSRIAEYLWTVVPIWQ